MVRTTLTVTPISRIPGYNLDMVFPPFAEANTLQIRKYDVTDGDADAHAV